MLRCTLLGIGAMASPRYRPAGLLVESGPWRVMLDGGPGEGARDALPDPVLPLDAWLVCDEHSELQRAIRRLAKVRGLDATVGSFVRPGLAIEPLDVRHTSHPTVGYRISTTGRSERGGPVVAWVPELLELPAWTADVDLLFAEAASWARPIRFARGSGGHASVLQVAGWARDAGVRRLVFVHLGRPTLRALDRGDRPTFGEIGVEGRTYTVG